jgi:hypothetical protein
VIDSYNKQRQDSLQVEEHWPTHHFCAKVFNAYVGISVVQQQRLYSYQYPGIANNDMPVKRFDDMIAAGIVERDRRILPKALQSPATRATLKRVAHSSGNNLKNSSKKLKQKGKTKGDQMQLTCFVCKRYKKAYSYTTATCAHCGTAVCMEIDRSKEHPDRIGTRLHEHLNTGNPDLRCNGKQRRVFPQQYQL